MRQGRLSAYFTGVAAKYLSRVEADRARSNQHEFNGVTKLRAMLGMPSEMKRFPARFIYLGDNDDDPPIEDAFLTWYDSRERDPKRTEWRLYFPPTTVSECIATGDLLVIGRRPDDSLLVVIAEADSTIANQVLWLFDIDDTAHPGYSVREELETEQDRLGFTERLILESIGVEVDTVEETLLDRMLDKFTNRFPTTREFSKFARSTVGPIDLKQDPDTAIMVWMEKEEILFRTLEKHFVAERLHKGFANDVDGFLSYSLSIQNRRKSRVGYALENHLEALFKGIGIEYARSAVTENKSKPDFLFPSANAYQDATFDPRRLTVLAVKSTCKERWRQVLSEADRVENKHLLTLETAISPNQTDEMISRHLQLVLPRSLHSTYTQNQRDWLMDVRHFVGLVQERQSRAQT